MDQQTQKKAHASKATPKTREQREQERRDRFIRLAEKRVNNALRAIKNVGRLGNKAIYKYEDAEAARIMEELASALARCRGQFQGREQQTGFRLF